MFNYQKYYDFKEKKTWTFDKSKRIRTQTHHSVGYKAQLLEYTPVNLPIIF